MQATHDDSIDEAENADHLSFDEIQEKLMKPTIEGVLSPEHIQRTALILSTNERAPRTRVPLGASGGSGAPITHDYTLI